MAAPLLVSHLQVACTALRIPLSSWQEGQHRMFRGLSCTCTNDTFRESFVTRHLDAMLGDDIELLLRIDEVQKKRDALLRTDIARLELWNPIRTFLRLFLYLAVFVVCLEFVLSVLMSTPPGISAIASYFRPFQMYLAPVQAVLRPLRGGQESQNSFIGTMTIRRGDRELAAAMAVPPTWTLVETVTDINPLLFARPLVLGHVRDVAFLGATLPSSDL
ncbi:hypothetical protein BV25DRAFT_1922720 [Artomyces pyxidatus]|uniref:Uncharacterized protein n=1 Tax=Artomyces pyxidatus TaxID=48021 RepID=A0ACB8SEM8_9AGAM|nr:hypothetical protein BV25DRAFT_1922720 [Artomyces pyxidatus]